jgi:hypothetical protein
MAIVLLTKGEQELASLIALYQAVGIPVCNDTIDLLLEESPRDERELLRVLRRWKAISFPDTHPDDLIAK